MTFEEAVKRHNVQFLGEATDGRPTLLLAHGFGCDQDIWSSVASGMANDYAVVLFDHMGCGRSDPKCYDPKRYTNLRAYAEDLVELVRSLNLHHPILIGHSVSGAIGWLASLIDPELFQQVIAIGPSPRYINDPPEYFGGFEEADVFELLDLMERNHFEWAGYLAPMVMSDEHPDLADELRHSFLRADPVISRRFAQTTFTSDIREIIPKLTVPSLILYCDQDVIVPLQVVDYLSEHVPNCVVRKLDARGHYPQMSHPTEVTQAILAGLRYAA